MNSVPRLTSLGCAIFVALAIAVPVRAAEPDLDRFKAEINGFIGRLGPSSNGVVRWAGSDPYEIRRDGDALVAVIANARLLFHTRQVDHLTLDRVEFRRIAQKEGGSLVELRVVLPKEMVLSEVDGTETKITLKDATANVLAEVRSGRDRETAIEIASARIDQPKTGAWVRFGPLSMLSKLVAERDGGWSGPVEFQVKNLEYFLPQGPVGGGIDRIAFSGNSAGPKLDELNKLHAAVDTLQNDDGRSPKARGAAFLAILPTIAAPFGTIRGEFALEGLAVRGVTGEALVSLSKVGSSMEITGLDGEEAAMRFSIHHEGLDLAPSVFDAAKVPRRVVLDLGVSGLSTEALSKMLQALGVMADDSGPGGNGNEQKKQQAAQQILGAAVTLNPTFHVYDIAVDTEEVGVDLTAEAKGLPLGPKGYTAAGDLVVRGFDAIPKLSAGLPFTEYLPVLKELGIEEKASDGTPRIDFHLASNPPKWITVNGNDVGKWFDETEPKPGGQRLLKPSHPPMQGNDVKSAQRALTAAGIAVEPDGVYSSATAAAIARFQKQNGINVSGVVDAATRRRLQMPTDAARQGGRN